MDKNKLDLKNLSKEEKISALLIIFLIVFSILALLLSFKVSNIKKNQLTYVNEVTEKVKTIAKYDVYDFTEGINEINKTTHIDVELKENDKILFTTLLSDNESLKESSSFLAIETLTVGTDRTIWLGIYDGLDYTGSFNNVFILNLLTIGMFGIVLTIVLLFWNRDKLHLTDAKKDLESITLENNRIQTEVNDLRDQRRYTLSKGDVSIGELFRKRDVETRLDTIEDKVVEEYILTRNLEVVVNDKESLENIEVPTEELVYEEIVIEEEVSEVYSDVKDVESEVIAEVDILEDKTEDASKGKYSGFTNKYKYLDGE